MLVDKSRHRNECRAEMAIQLVHFCMCVYSVQHEADKPFMIDILNARLFPVEATITITGSALPSIIFFSRLCTKNLWADLTGLSACLSSKFASMFCTALPFVLRKILSTKNRTNDRIRPIIQRIKSKDCMNRCVSFECWQNQISFRVERMAGWLIERMSVKMCVTHLIITNRTEKETWKHTLTHEKEDQMK